MHPRKWGTKLRAGLAVPDLSGLEGTDCGWYLISGVLVLAGEDNTTVRLLQLGGGKRIGRHLCQ